MCLTYTNIQSFICYKCKELVLIRLWCGLVWWQGFSCAVNEINLYLCDLLKLFTFFKLPPWERAVLKHCPLWCHTQIWNLITEAKPTAAQCYAECVCSVENFCSYTLHCQNKAGCWHASDELFWKNDCLLCWETILKYSEIISCSATDLGSFHFKSVA